MLGRHKSHGKGERGFGEAAKDWQKWQEQSCVKVLHALFPLLHPDAQTAATGLLQDLCNKQERGSNREELP